MKHIIAVLCLAVLVFSVTGCQKSERVFEREEAYRIQEIEDGVSLVKRIEYIKDPRTNICFAYARAPSAWAFFMTVPCERIPSELLTIAK
jgi:hypothetical protein